MHGSQRRLLTKWCSKVVHSTSCIGSDSLGSMNSSTVPSRTCDSGSSSSHILALRHSRPKEACRHLHRPAACWILLAVLLEEREREHRPFAYYTLDLNSIPSRPTHLIMNVYHMKLAFRRMQNFDARLRYSLKGGVGVVCRF